MKKGSFLSGLCGACAVEHRFVHGLGKAGKSRVVFQRLRSVNEAQYPWNIGENHFSLYKVYYSLPNLLSWYGNISFHSIFFPQAYCMFFQSFGFTSTRYCIII